MNANTVNTTNKGAVIEWRPLSFIREQHWVRPLQDRYVDSLVDKIKEMGLLPFPLSVTPDGLLYSGNHRREAFVRLGITHCWMYVCQPDSLDRDALKMNSAQEGCLPMTLVDYAELVWRKLSSGQTQNQVAEELVCSRGQISQYAMLQKIVDDAWCVIATNLRSGWKIRRDGAVAEDATVVAFTEGLLRDIVPLTPDQQLDLVQALAENRIQKGKFKILAQHYRARNEAAAWVQQQMAGADIVDRCLIEVAKGIYDAEWQANQGPGQKLKQLVDTAREEWERKNSVVLIHGDFYEKVRDVGDGSVDLILTDPPYNVANDRIFKFEGRSDISQDFGDWDKYEPETFIALFDAWAREFHRILVVNGSGYVFTSDVYISDLRRALNRAGLRVKATLAWHKTNPGTQVVKTNFKSSVEYILFFTKGESGHTFNWQGENEMHNFIETPICGGSERLLDAKKNTLHPTQKPLAVLQHLLEISSHPGDMIFDGFMGVGSTARAARDMGRKFIGIEQDATFFDAAQRRMNDA